jgi:hypothetical protein
MSASKPQISIEEDLFIHIFTVSSAIVGVCLTVIGILRFVITVQKIDTFADDLIATDAIFFLLSSILSYMALRSRSKQRMHGLELTADYIFIVALLFMAVICGFITYAIAIPPL